MKYKKRLLILMSAICCLLLSPVATVKADEQADNLHRVSENEVFLFEYDEQAADIYVTDKRTGKVWSNTVSSDYYKEELSNWNVMSQLMTVTYAKKNGNIDMVNVFDNGKKANAYKLITEYQNEELIISVSLTNEKISFEDRFWLDETGLNYKIPWDSIKESGSSVLMNIQMMPTFGAAVAGEEGYTLIPDGSGALIHYKNYDDPNAKLYTYSYYGTDELDIGIIQQNQEQGYYGLMLPVYGMSHHDGAVLVAVVEGEADTDFNIAPSGFKFKKLNRAYLTFNYRIYESVTLNGESYSKLVPYANASDREVKMIFLDNEHNSYSDMAVSYRNYLEAKGILQKKQDSGGVPTVVELVMGANKTGIFGNKLITATTYSQAAEIVTKLGNQLPNLSVILEGWGKGGYDTLPTIPKLERKFGGRKGWNELTKACDKVDVELYLNMDFINANKETGKFNNRKDTIRTAFSGIVNHAERYLLNPIRVLSSLFQKAVKSMNFEANSFVQFDSVGSLLTYDFSKSAPASRTKMKEAYEGALKDASSQMECVGVSGGNQYVLPYVSLMSDIPDHDSDYYFGDQSVPFYQIVVHGCVNYTSSAGNLSYDLQYQKMKWIETGSLPYFVITYESPLVLNETSYNDLFSSQFSVWEEKMKTISEELNENLSDIWNQQIQAHEERDGAVIVSYEGGDSIYLNYSTEPITVDGISVAAMNYTIVRGE